MVKKKGILTLIPTPLDEQSMLESVAFEKLRMASTEFRSNSIIVVEDHKPCRRRWSHWGLPREVIDEFVCLNEHTVKEESQRLYEMLKQGQNVYLMSDGGLPAFCDPGRELVDLCHQGEIQVTSTPYCNSFTLAIALSGLDHKHFEFFGFIPKKGEERESFLKQVLKKKHTIVLNDTPYRMKALLEQISSLTTKNHKVFLAMDLNMPTEQLLRGSASTILRQITDFKREFVLVISQINPD